MTTLYRPVLIESAEQAEALPKGSILFDGDPEYGDTYVQGGDDWHTDGYPYVLSEALRAGLDVTALVPIEAEEETTKTYPDGEPYYTHTRVSGGRENWRYIVRGDEGNQLADVTDEVNAWEATRKTRTRYVTPWEEV